MTQPDPLHRHDAQQAAQERAERLAPYVGAPVRITARWFIGILVPHVERALRREGYLGVVASHYKGMWRIELGDEDEYLWLNVDDFEVMPVQAEGGAP